MKLMSDSKGTSAPPESKMSANTQPNLSSTTNGAGSGNCTKFISKKQQQNTGSNNGTINSNSFNMLWDANSDIDGTIFPSPDDFQEGLKHVEENHNAFLLSGINNLRRQGQFCDITLVVEEHDLPMHRVVAAIGSPYLFDFLSCLEDTTEPQPIYKLKDVPYTGFHYLLDYMYTGSLSVPVSDVPVVYATSLILKMESATRACANFLASRLTTTNCLGIRRLTKDKSFRLTVDEYINANLEDIMNSKSFFGLSNLQVEVVGLDENISDEAMERRLFSLVLDWAKNNLNDFKPKMDRLIEKVNVLHLGSDNTLRDCADVEDAVLSSDDDIVQDYKILARRRVQSKTPSMGKNSRCMTNGNGAQPFHKFSLNPEEAVSVAEREWSIVATRKTSENAFLAITMLDGRLMAISVHVRPPVTPHSDSNSGCDSPPDTIVNGGRLSPAIIRKASITPLTGMSTPRCALGAAAFQGQLIVYGGYDRGECLSSVEAFNMKDNKWTSLPSMNMSRARFSAGELDDVIYVCGGSDGWKELSCVEKFDYRTQEWNFVSSMLKERSSHGVATLNGKLYCVGGCEGQRSIANCEMYDPSTDQWSPIASLNTARSQMCVCAMNGLLFAIGGTDLWNTLNTVEVYDPAADEWTLHSQLNIARRGAGVDIIQAPQAPDRMVVVGGSDGSQSLVSTEMYDPVSDLWSMGPVLNTPRANLSAVTLDNRLFAVGGFSGKKFLNTIEWLDVDDMEWFGHTPRPGNEDDSPGISTPSDPTRRLTQASEGGAGSQKGGQKQVETPWDFRPTSKTLSETRDAANSNGSSTNECASPVGKSEPKLL